MRSFPSADPVFVVSPMGGTCVQEAEHEFTPALHEGKKGSNTELLARAPRRCRELMANEPSLKGGMFSGLRALVAIKEAKKNALVTRVLVGGGAEVENCKGTPSASQRRKATAMIVELGTQELHAESFSGRIFTADDISLILTGERTLP